MSLLNKILDPKLIRQLFFFGIVGLTATATHYFVTVGSHEAFGLSLYLSNIIGYCCAVGVSYFGHSKLTFQVNLSTRIFLKFIIVSLSVLALSELLLLFLEESLALQHRVSMLVVVFTVPFVSYALSKLWVYKEPSSDLVRDLEP